MTIPVDVSCIAVGKTSGLIFETIPFAIRLIVYIFISIRIKCSHDFEMYSAGTKMMIKMLDILLIRPHRWFVLFQ